MKDLLIRSTYTYKLAVFGGILGILLPLVLGLSIGLEMAIFVSFFAWIIYYLLFYIVIIFDILKKDFNTEIKSVNILKFICELFIILLFVSSNSSIFTFIAKSTGVFGKIFCYANILISMILVITLIIKTKRAQNKL